MTLAPSPAKNPEISQRIDALMHAYQGNSPGASLLVIYDGKTFVSRAYGIADLEDGSAATPATNYRLASVSKQFTAAAVLLLAQKGQLSLDEPIGKWLPTVPPAAASIAVRHLLTHTSGLIDYEDLIPPGTARQLHDPDVLHLLELQNRTYFEAGTRYRYSDSGYALLALIVQAAARKDFASYLRENIFLPLGMQNSIAYEQGISTVVNRAFGYSVVNGSWQRTDQSLTSAVLGDGGIYSSIEDLAKWDAALYDSRLLTEQSREFALLPATATDDPDVQYGMGWRITGKSVWHSGETLGFRNVIVRYPTERLTVVILTNRNDPEPYSLALAIAKLFIADADAVRATAVVVGPDSNEHLVPPISR